MCGKRRPSFLAKAKTWLYNPWKIALDQSMTFHEVLPDQRQLLRLSAPVSVDNKYVFLRRGKDITCVPNGSAVPLLKRQNILFESNHSTEETKTKTFSENIL